MSEVRILCAQGERPVMVNGIISVHSDGRMSVDATDGAGALTTGAKVVVNVAGESGSLRCVVTAIDADGSGGHRVSLSEEAAHQADKRDYPRLHAGLPIRFRPVSEDEAARWAAGDPIGGNWAEPDPYMNFSVSGLRFDCNDELPEGSLIALELQIGDDVAMWRASARIVRCFKATGDRPASIAVTFESLPTGARDALSELTLQIQETLL